MSDQLAVTSLDDLLPVLAEAVDFARQDSDEWIHAFAIPSAVYPGRFHAGCVRHAPEGMYFKLSNAPLEADDFPEFMRQHEPRWSEGSLHRWPCTGAIDNPLERPREYLKEFYTAIRRGCQ